MFREEIGCVVLRIHSTQVSAECVLLQEDIDQLRMLLHLDFSTIFIVCFSMVCCIVTIFDCRHVLLSGMSLHRH